MEFDTAVASLTREDEEVYPFTVVEIGEDEDGNEVRRKVECRALQPEEGQLLVFMADGMGRNSGLPEKTAAMVNFLVDNLDEESKAYIVGRLMDRSDPFGAEQIKDIVFWLIEEWGGRPTKQPSDFAPSRKTGGQSSTRRTTKSTSSASRRTAS